MGEETGPLSLMPLNSWTTIPDKKRVVVCRTVEKSLHLYKTQVIHVGGLITQMFQVWGASPHDLGCVVLDKPSLVSNECR